MTAVRVIDAFPPLSLEKRPMCCARLSRHCVECHELWAKAKPLSSKMRRRKALSIPHDQCGNHARYKINGAYYCRKHGALVALDLIAEKVAP